MAEKKEAAAENEAPKQGNGKKMIILIVGVLVLLGAGVGGTLYFTGMLGGGKSADAEKPAEEAAKKVPVYFAFPDPFTVNYETGTGLRYLQVQMELMSYDPAVIEGVKTHLPVIKNNLVLLLSSQSYEALISLEGKEELRKLALHEVKSVLGKYAAGHDAVEEVYFTNFVMQ